MTGSTLFRRLHVALRPRLSLTLLSVCPLLIACAAPTSAPVRPQQIPAADTSWHGTPPGIITAAVALQNDYRRGAWAGVRREFVSASLGSALVGKMEGWKAQDISAIHVAVDYAHPIGKQKYVATLRFSGDKRAEPHFEIYQFSTRTTRARVVGPAESIPGSNYLQADWTVTRLQHYVVYHSPYELAGNDRSFLTELERQRALFARRFRVTLPAEANLYVYPTPREMGRLTHGGCGGQPGEIGCTSPFTRPPTIHTTIGAFFHEPIHVYELALEPKPTGRLSYVAPLFIGEGTAVALEDRELDPRLSDYCSDIDYAPLDACARVAVREVDPMTILSDKGFTHSTAGDAYALGGSFVKFLILRYGYVRFGHFYYRLAAQPTDKVSDYDVATRAVYRQSIQALIGAWKRSL